MKFSAALRFGLIAVACLEHVSCSTSEGLRERKLNQDKPPINCAFVRSVDSEGYLERDDAICANGSGGWKFGINGAGKVALWKPNGSLVRTLAMNQDALSFDTEDEWMWIESWADDNVSSAGFEVFCTQRDYHYHDEDYGANPDVRVNADQDDGVIVHFGGNAPYQELMTIDEDGTMKVDWRFCSLSGDDWLPPEECAYTGTMDDISSARLFANQALCDKGQAGYKYGINQRGLYGLWVDDTLVRKFKNGIRLIQVYGSYEEYSIFAFGELPTMDMEWKIVCHVYESQDNVAMLRLNSDTNNLLRFRAGNEVAPWDKLAVINERGQIEVDEAYCELEK